jgi:flavin reductase (DIM6/NTAB) family NADH-FMN oxidoreductase RutF
MVVFSSDGAKHSYLNAKASGEFTFSLATDELKHAMNMTSEDIPEGESEFETARLTPVPGVEVAASFVGESPAALECVVVSAQELEDRHGTPTSRYIVIGEVVRTHIRDEYIDENGRFRGIIQPTGLRPRFLERLSDHGVHFDPELFISDNGTVPLAMRR